MISVTKDGYFKRSSVKSFSSSGKGALPALKDGDILIAATKAFTTDFLICFTNLGNYIYIPVYLLSENRWKDEGVHINNIVSFSGSEEMIIRAFVVSDFREDIFAILATRNGQIKRTSINQFETNRFSKPIRCIRLMSDDELVDAKISTGNQNVMVLSLNGSAVLFNENELTPIGIKASGVKAMSGLKGDKVAAILTFDQDERNKIVLVTNRGCTRIFDVNKVTLVPRLGKNSSAFRSFKSDVHQLIHAEKAIKELPQMDFISLDKSNKMFEFSIDDFRLTDVDKYAKRNIPKMTAKMRLKLVFSPQGIVERCDKTLISTPVVVKEKSIKLDGTSEDGEEKGTVEQISIFDDLKD